MSFSTLLRRALLVSALTGAAPGLAAGQGLPWYRPINPLVTSRTTVGFVPVMDLPSGWSVGATLDYASLVEVATRPDAELTVDMERGRLTGTVVRRVGARGFVGAQVPFTVAYQGVLDGVMDWYHDLFGIDESGRESRPHYTFDYELDLGGRSHVYDESVGLDDITLLGGIQFGPHWQTTLSLMLPTSTAGNGYKLGTIATAAAVSARSSTIADRIVLEGSAAVGYTPRHGELSEWQQTVFASTSGGARIRFWGLQSVYGNVFWHSPVYHDTGITGLDGQGVSLDVGFLFRIGDGPEILAGLVEDLYAVGPAVDLTLRLGVRW